MTDQYSSNLSLADAARMLLACAGEILVLSHAKPDGDAIGSIVAVTGALRRLGKSAIPVLVPPVSDNLAHFARLVEPVLIEEPDAAAQSDALPRDPAMIVVVDTGAYSQVGPMADTVRAHLDKTLILDHHLSGDIEAASRVIDPKAAANCEIVARLIDELEVIGQAPLLTGCEDPRAIAIREALFIGVASDTGWFRFSSVTPATHELAARLIRLGVDHAELYDRLEQTERPEKLALLIRAVASLRLLAGGRAAVMVIRENDFQETGARPEETDRLIDIPQQVATVQVICLVTERTVDKPAPGEKQTLTSLSFRSKPHGEDGGEPINVAEIANGFGGGGHARAAGARVQAPVDEVLAKVVDTLENL